MTRARRERERRLAELLPQVPDEGLEQMITLARLHLGERPTLSEINSLTGDAEAWMHHASHTWRNQS